MRRWRSGSALALFLYPHSVTGVLSSTSRHVIRRNAALLPAYSFLLGLIALLGFMAIAAGVARRRNTPPSSSNTAPISPCRRCSCNLPGVVRGLRLRRHRHRRAGAGGDHVDRRGQSLHAQRLPAFISPDCTPTAEAQMAKWVSLWSSSARCSSSFAADAIRDPIATAGRRLDHPDLARRDLGLYTRWLNPVALLLGWAAGIISGTAMVATTDFKSSIFRWPSAASPCRATPRSTR